MGMSSPIHLFILAAIAMLMLGGGRFSSTMADVAKGVKAFKKGMADPEDESEHRSLLGGGDAPADAEAKRS